MRNSDYCVVFSLTSGTLLVVNLFEILIKKFESISQYSNTTTIDHFTCRVIRLSNLQITKEIL